MRIATVQTPQEVQHLCLDRGGASSPQSTKESPVLYSAATNNVVSATLVVEREEPGHALKVQCPVYFVSEVLTNTKSRYPQTQKLLYAFVMATKKLQHYFTEHEVSVITSFPLGEVVRNRNAVGRISKWAVELMGYDIKFVPRTTIKSQPWPISSPSGPKSKPRPQRSLTSTGPFTSTGRSWDPTRGLGLS